MSLATIMEPRCGLLPHVFAAYLLFTRSNLMYCDYQLKNDDSSHHYLQECNLSFALQSSLSCLSHLVLHY